LPRARFLVARPRITSLAHLCPLLSRLLRAANVAFAQPGAVARLWALTSPLLAPPSSAWAVTASPVFEALLLSRLPCPPTAGPTEPSAGAAASLFDDAVAAAAALGSQQPWARLRLYAEATPPALQHLHAAFLLPASLGACAGVGLSPQMRRAGMLAGGGGMLPAQQEMMTITSGWDTERAGHARLRAVQQLVKWSARRGCGIPARSLVTCVHSVSVGHEMVHTRGAASHNASLASLARSVGIEDLDGKPIERVRDGDGMGDPLQWFSCPPLLYAHSRPHLPLSGPPIPPSLPLPHPPLTAMP